VHPAVATENSRRMHRIGSTRCGLIRSSPIEQSHSTLASLIITFCPVSQLVSTKACEVTLQFQAHADPSPLVCCHVTIFADRKPLWDIRFTLTSLLLRHRRANSPLFCARSKPVCTALDKHRRATLSSIRVKPVSNSKNGHSPCRTSVFVAAPPSLKERHKSATVGEIHLQSPGKNDKRA